MANKSLFLQFAVLYLAVCVSNFECKVSKELQVTLPHGGGVTGKYMTSFRGRGVRAFLGIPFAEPPVGDLRFKAPFPKLPWTGFIPTNVDNKMCPQGMGVSVNATVVGAEDCLYVNVFAPLEPKTKGSLPVMIFIHGGGFNMGNGGAPLYTPEYFLDHDVVYVSGNYRLGALGFLNLESTIAGNLGLKDQVLLLQWVQDNIATFGGDPNQVTIFGESAGAGSVAYHLISPLSYKKFHKAILQSGTQYAPWAFDFHGNNFKNAVDLGKELNCPLTKDKETHSTYLDCLKGKSAEDIVKASAKLLDMDSQLLNPFLPVAEESLEGFVSKKPADFTRSHGLDIPILIGVTSQEGVLKTAMAYGSDSAWEKMNTHMDDFIDELFVGKVLSESKRTEVQNMVKEFYFKNGQFEKKSLMNTTDFFSDGFFVSAMDEFLSNRLETNKNAAETYVYLFAHRAAASLTDLFGIMLGLPEVDVDLGVCHADDLLSFFPINKNLLSNIVPTQLDGFIQRTVTDMWVNFATNGKPTNGDAPAAWNPARGFPLDYLRIGNYGDPEKETIAMETGLLEERMNLWRRLKAIAMPSAK